MAQTVVTTCQEQFVSIPVYNERGKKLQYSVTAVMPTKHIKTEAAQPGWLAEHGFNPKITGVDIVGLPAGNYTVWLKGPKGERVEREVIVFGGCLERLSQTVYEPRPARPGEADRDLITGRLEGCAFQGDWWVRLVPMTGQFSRSFEGLVRRDGVIGIPGHFDVGRYVLLVGFADKVVRTSEVNLWPSQNLDSIGTISLLNSCPPTGEDVRR
ncbi:MAG: hypothetical protein QM757_24005 [Paludibaculum sp.]